MKKLLLTLTLVFACLFAVPAEVTAQQVVVIGYQPAVDYYGNYYWQPVYGYANTYRQPATKRSGYRTPAKTTKAIRNPAALYGVEQARRKQEEIRAQIRKSQKERDARWAKSFSTGG